MMKGELVAVRNELQLVNELEAVKGILTDGSQKSKCPFEGTPSPGMRRGP